MEYIIYDPTPKDILKSKPYYDDVYKHLISSGVPSENELMALLLEKGLWTPKQDIELENLQSKVVELRKQIPSLTFRSNEKSIVVENIKYFESRIKKLLNTKSSLLSTSAEYIAKIEKFKKLLYELSFYTNGDRVWNTWENFKNGNDQLVNKLMSECYFNPDITESKIRLLAKSEPWRTTWLSGVKVGNLFNKPSIDMTDYQRTLISWSILYDNVYEHPECPSNDIVANDELLDAWLQEQSDKREKDRNKDASKTSNDKINNAQEIGIFVDTKEDAKKVYSLNSAASISLIKQRENLLRKNGMVKETELPDVKQNLLLEVNNLERNHGIKLSRN